MPKKKVKCVCNGCDEPGEATLDWMCLDCFEVRLFDGSMEPGGTDPFNPHWMDQ